MLFLHLSEGALLCHCYGSVLFPEELQIQNDYYLQNFIMCAQTHEISAVAAVKPLIHVLYDGYHLDLLRLEFCIIRANTLILPPSTILVTCDNADANVVGSCFLLFFPARIRWLFVAKSFLLLPVVVSLCTTVTSIVSLLSHAIVCNALGVATIVAVASDGCGCAERPASCCKNACTARCFLADGVDVPGVDMADKTGRMVCCTVVVVSLLPGERFIVNTLRDVAIALPFGEVGVLFTLL